MTDFKNPLRVTVSGGRLLPLPTTISHQLCLSPLARRSTMLTKVYSENQHNSIPWYCFSIEKGSVRSRERKMGAPSALP